MCTRLLLPGLPVTLTKVYESAPHGATVICFNLVFKSLLMSASGITAPWGNEGVRKFTFYWYNRDKRPHRTLPKNKNCKKQDLIMLNSAVVS